jgi:hypothetical protein
VFGWGLRGRYERGRIRVQQQAEGARARLRAGIGPRPEVPVVVSLTTTSQRIATVPAVVRRLLGQTVRPHRILLWLSTEPYLFDEGIGPLSVPRELWRCAGDRLEIRYTDNTGPYRKIIPALPEAHPRGLSVVTIDDDHLVPVDWLERLVEAHAREPRAVVCYQARQIRRGADGALLPYRQWPMWEGAGFRMDLLPIGFGGVLYPPGTLPPGTEDTAVFTELAPRTDDLWLRMHTLRAGAPVLVVPPKTYVPCRSASPELFADNHPSGNDEALARLSGWAPGAFSIPADEPEPARSRR